MTLNNKLPSFLLFLCVSTLSFGQIFPDKADFTLKGIINDSDLVHNGSMQKLIALDSHQVFVGCRCELKNGVKNIFTYDRITDEFTQIGLNSPSPSSYITRLASTWYVMDSTSQKIYYYHDGLADWQLWQSFAKRNVFSSFKDSLLIFIEENHVKVYNSNRILQQSFNIPIVWQSIYSFHGFSENSQGLFFFLQPGSDIHRFSMSNGNVVYNNIQAPNQSAFGVYRSIYADDSYIYITGNTGVSTNSENLYKYTDCISLQ